MSTLRVVVLMGGPDAEREISIQSGTAVANALNQTSRYSVSSTCIDRVTVKELKQMQADVFFPVLHGPYGEGGPLQELLEETGVPFVGSGSIAARKAMDKATTKEIATALCIQTPPWSMLRDGEQCNINAPLVLKPTNDGSSIDLEICMTNKEVASARVKLHANRSTLLAETYIEGREITVGILNGQPLPIIEIVPHKDTAAYNYEAKYERDDTQFIVEPSLPSNDCVNSALLLYQTMEIQDIARVDFIINEEGAWLLEINTMPGFTDHSLVPMAAQHVGLPMTEICASLVSAATSREVK